MPDQYKTSPTLLRRLANLSDHEAWARFIDLYCPMIGRFVSRYETDATEVEEVVHRVCVRVLAGISKFEYDPKRGRFRNWLFVLSVHEVQHVQQQAQRDTSSFLPEGHLTKDIESAWDDDFKSQVLDRAVQLIRSEFSDEAWFAFEQQWISQCDVEAYAKKIGRTASWMYQQKSLITHRLREEVMRLTDDSSIFMRPG